MELCDQAVLQHSYALGEVPERHKTLKLCYMALKKDPWAIHYVPEALRDVLTSRCYECDDNEEGLLNGFPCHVCKGTTRLLNDIDEELLK